MGKDRLARLRGYPEELALFDNDAERKAVLERFHWRLFLSWRFWLPLVLWSTSIVLIPFASLLVRRILPGIPQAVVTMTVGGLVIGGSGLAIQFLWRKPCQRYLREQLVAKGVPICLHCGYDLRGRSDPRCPECGKAFDPGLIKPPGAPAGSDQTND